MPEPGRVSQTVIRASDSRDEPSSQGFRAELPGWDLATLLQMSCARGGRACVEIRCSDRVGYIYMNEGRLVHASVGSLMGEAAVATMLEWPGGDFSLSDRPWPLKPSMDASAEIVLLRAAQTRDEAARVQMTRAAEAGPVSSAARSPASSTERPTSRPGANVTPFGATSVVAAVPEARDSSVPAANREGPVLASVRIDMNGEIVARQGAADSLAPLVGYVTRMGALLGSLLALEPFEALSADLGTKRALIFVEGNEMVGLLLSTGALHQELRQQLGV